MSEINQPSPDQPKPEEVLFLAALKRPSSERAIFLDAVCRGDTPLRGRLEALLAMHDLPDAVPEPEAGTMRSTSEAKPADEFIGRVIGRYKLLEKIGEGGCGVVYLAEQVEPIRRRLALKLIKPGMDSRAVLARFEAERQALALMDHPNIAKVLDGGTSDQGHPFFVMELVQGLKITEHSDRHRLSTEDRIKLFIPVCQAVQHAHKKGIIHRDLKPSNVFVTMHDDVAVPKVIDFGVAKALGSAPLTDKTAYTALDQFIGTPAYVSPEQAAHREQAIDARTDVYSLGVLLYELLTGRTPFDAKALLESGYEHMLKIIREKDPPRPSTRLSTLELAALTSVAHVRQAEPPHLVHQIRGDLDWIAVKCLEKDRARRYDSVESLAADLRRHLECRPVMARPPNAIYRLQKTVRRHRIACFIAAAVLLGLIGGLCLSYWPGKESGNRVSAEAVAKTVLVVNSAADQGPGSLREAVKIAAPGQRITFAPALSGQTIILTSGQIELNKNIIIDGDGLARAVQISGNHASRIFLVQPHVEATLNSLVLLDGDAGTGDGGAIWNAGEPLVLNRCTLCGNSSRANGGAILTANILVMNQCTVASNSAANGGAAYLSNGGHLQMTHSTIAGNFASAEAGGIYDLEELYMTNSIIAGNRGGAFPDITYGGCCGRAWLAGVNIIQAANVPGFSPFQGAGIIRKVDPLLAPLGDYGGPTPTMPPLRGSPAIDNGDDQVTNTLTTDQRGFPRRVGRFVDIGAIEADAALLDKLPAAPANASTTNGILSAATNWVLNTADAGPGSLRAVVRDAVPGDYIHFVPELSGKTISLINGSITLDKQLVIEASDLKDGVRLASACGARVFEVRRTATIRLDSLTIEHGQAGGLITGGGIKSEGSLLLYRCALAHNTATFGGGLFVDSGVVAMHDCLVVSNTADEGAGVFISNSSGENPQLWIYNSTFADNAATNGHGGGLRTARAFVYGIFCTISQNSARGGGGGVASDAGNVSFENSIIAGNEADYQGATAGSAPGTNSNLWGAVGGRPNLLEGNPKLAPLGNFGGPTLTMPPLPGSPAIDAGREIGESPLLSPFDQRGLPRRVGAHPDLGAVEVQ